MPQSGVPVVRIIDTPAATLRLSRLSGDLVGLRWKDPSLELIGEPRLGENFRILIPRPGYEADYFYSRDQKVSRIEPAPDGVVCVYNSLRNSRETLPVQVRYRIRVEGGQVLFSIQVDNPTDRKLAEVMYGIIGGQQGIGKPARYGVDGSRGQYESVAGAVLPVFAGADTAEAISAYVMTRCSSRTRAGCRWGGWTCITRKLGVGYYYADQDPDTRLINLEVELRPFSKSANVGGQLAQQLQRPTGEPDGPDDGLGQYALREQGNIQGGTRGARGRTPATGTTPAESIAPGSTSTSIFERPKSWLRQENAWQSIILSNSEDVVVHRFDELPKLAADAKKYGITTFEILGWDIGGIDRGYPQYTPDPRLGTPAEFKKALADMRAIGVHPLIFSNIQVADTATPIFRDRLKSTRWTGDGRPIGA